MTPSIDHPDTLIYRYDMTVEEAAELARRFIYVATVCDAPSGVVVSVYRVGPDGWKKLSGDILPCRAVVPSTVEHEMVEVDAAA